MVEVLALVLGSLVWGPQVALSMLSPPTFSPVEQCGAASTSFSGSIAVSALPLTLTMFPVDSVPLTITLPDSSWVNSAGGNHEATIFLPFQSNTSFVATLQSSSGEFLTNVSNIITVQPSLNSTCLQDTTSDPPAQLYNLDTPLAQCEAFTVSFDSTLIQAPSVRALIAGEEVMTPMLTSQGFGWASYILNAPSGSQVLFDFDDGKGHTESTAFLPVGGDLSINGCLSRGLATPNQPNGSSMLPRLTVIAIATLTTVAVFLAIIFVISYTLLQRHERRWTAINEKTKQWSPPPPPRAPWEVFGRTDPSPNPAPTPDLMRDSSSDEESEPVHDGEMPGQGSEALRGGKKQVRVLFPPRTGHSSDGDEQEMTDSSTIDDTMRLYNAAHKSQRAPRYPAIVALEAFPRPPPLAWRFIPKHPDAPESVSSRPDSFDPFSRRNSSQPPRSHFSVSTQSAYSIEPISPPAQAHTVTVRPPLPRWSPLRLVSQKRRMPAKPSGPPKRPDTVMTTDSSVYYQGIMR